MKMMCIVLGVLCVGCASRPSVESRPELTHPAEEDLLDGKEAVLLYGIGAAQTPGEAEKQARQELADQIEIIVDAIQIDYRLTMIQSGGAYSSDNFFTSVKQELKREIQPNVYIADRRTGPQNVCYALAVCKNSDIQRMITEAAIVEAAGNADFHLEVVRKSIERELNKSSTKEWREQKPAEAETAHRQAEESRKQTKTEFAFRKHWDLASGFVQWGDDGLLGRGYSIGIHWSPVPFTVIGFEMRFGSIGRKLYSELMAGYAFTLGLVFPFTEHIKIFGDGLLEIGNFGLVSGLIAGVVSPGFDGGIHFWWDWIGFDIKYRGIWYENHYLHSISIDILWWDWR